MTALHEPATRKPATRVPPDVPRWRPRPGWRKALLFTHILASVALVGEVWGLVVLNLYATLTEEQQLSYAAYRLMEALVFAGGIPLSLIALVSGIALGLTTRWGVLRHWWVFAKLLLLIGTVLIGMFLFDPETLAADPPSEAGQWTEVATVSTQLSLLLTATALSVWKPRGRLRSRG